MRTINAVTMQKVTQGMKGVVKGMDKAMVRRNTHQTISPRQPPECARRRGWASLRPFPKGRRERGVGLLSARHSSTCTTPTFFYPHTSFFAAPSLHLCHTPPPVAYGNAIIDAFFHGGTRINNPGIDEFSSNDAANGQIRVTI